MVNSPQSKDISDIDNTKNGSNSLVNENSSRIESLIGIKKEDIDLMIEEKIQLLPPMPQTIINIENLSKSEEKDIDKLLKIIEGDPMIVANVLKIVNSAMYGFSSQIKNLRQASILLGYNMTANISIGTAVNNLFKPDLSPYGINIEDFIYISGLQSRIIEKWGEPKIRNIKNDLQMAAFLQEISKIIISMIIIENGLNKEFKEKIYSELSINEVEKYFLNETGATITSQIFTHWKFNQKIIDYIRYSDNPEESPEEFKISSYALKLAKTIFPVKHFESNEENIAEAEKIAKKGNFNEKALEKLLIDLNLI